MRLQMVLKKTAWFMRFTLGTTATESLAACANTLLGMVRIKISL